MASDKQITFSIEPLKTKNALLKILETILGAVCLVAVVIGEVPVQSYYYFHFFAFCVQGALFGTVLLLLSYVMSPVDANKMPRTVFELLHDSISFLFYMGIGISFLIQMAKAQAEYGRHEFVTASAVLGIGNGLLYFASSFQSYKTFKGE